MSAIIIVGSAREDGNTAKVARQLANHLDCKVIDLISESVAPYDYSGNYPAQDNFIELLSDRLLQHDLIVLASPVYWYTMSGQLKAFVDRFTDLLTTHKSLGRQLRGKRLAVLSCAEDEDINASFYDAFRLTADYLGMTYDRQWHGWVEGCGGVRLELR